MKAILRSGAVLLLLAACTPRTPPPAPAPLPPPPAPTAPQPSEPERARAAWEEATRLSRQGRWPQAEARLREAVRLDPDQQRYHMALADALIQLGYHSAAADELMAAIQIEESRAEPNHRVLVVDYDRLIELLERVNRLDEARSARGRQEEHRRRRDQ